MASLLSAATRIKEPRHQRRQSESDLGAPRALIDDPDAAALGKRADGL